MASPPVVTSVVVEHGHRLQDGCRATEMTQAPGHIESLTKQRLSPVVIAGQDSELSRQRAGRGETLLIADAPVRREAPRRQGGRLCGATQRELCMRSVIQGAPQHHRFADLGRQGFSIVKQTVAGRPIPHRVC